jgi:hypothetical protein
VAFLLSADSHQAEKEPNNNDTVLPIHAMPCLCTGTEKVQQQEICVIFEIIKKMLSSSFEFGMF